MQGLMWSLAVRFPQAQRLRNDRDHKTGIAQRCQGNEYRTVWEKFCGIPCRLNGEARLAHAACASKGE
jgi:hypothetical protein